MPQYRIQSAFGPDESLSEPWLPAAIAAASSSLVNSRSPSCCAWEVRLPRGSAACAGQTERFEITLRDMFEVTSGIRGSDQRQT